MQKRNVFAILVSALSDYADVVHHFIRADRLPWGLRLAIAILWDVFDTAFRIASWPFLFVLPGITHAVRGLLDIALVGGGVALWGAPGLLQASEFIFDVLHVIPGAGFIFDLVPVLTISGFVSRRRERESSTAVHPKPVAERMLPAARKKESGMEIIFGLIGLVIGVIGWFAGLVSGSWVFGLAIIGALVGLVIRVARFSPIPPAFLRIAAIVFGVLLAVNLSFLGGYYWFASEEGYRPAAWDALVQEGNPWVALAQRADSVGEAIPTEEITGAIKSFFAEAIKKHKGFGIPALDRALGELKGEKKEGEKKEAPSGDVSKFAAEIKARKLGRVSGRLYASDYTLERAKQMREREIRFYANWLYVTGGAFGLVVLIAIAQATMPHHEARTRALTDDDPLLG